MGKRILGLVLAFAVLCTFIMNASAAEHEQTEGAECIEETEIMPEDIELLGEDIAPADEEAKEEILEAFETGEQYGDCLYYEVNDDGTGVTITDCDELVTGTLEIPTEINGLPVTGIGDYAFEYCATLTGVTMPDSVTSIGSYSFRNCVLLRNITIPDSVAEIGSYAFYYCQKLTDIILPDGVKSVEKFTFYNCTGLTDVTLPESVTTIGNSAFYGCTALTGITIPAGVISIDNNAFYNTGIYNDSYNWEDGVLYISNHLIKAKSSIVSGTYDVKADTYCIASRAFGYCSDLTAVTIPDSVTGISGSSFMGCGSLTINVDENNAVYSSLDGVLFNKDKTEIVAYAKDELMPEYEIPDGVTSIGKMAFYHCTGLTNVTIPDSVTAINYYAFYHCTGLTSITIPRNVTEIGYCIFANCGSLEINTDENNAVYSSLDGVLFNKDRTEIVVYAKDISTPEYEIPDGVTSIGNRAFYYCSGLTSVTIPDSVTVIDDYAFYCCDGLTGVTLPDDVTYIGRSTFYCCSGFTDMEIPSGVTSISDYTFYGCSGLTSVTMPDNIAYIGRSAFYKCSGLTDIEIPSGVTGIGSLAFYDCWGLTSITIPDSVTSIGNAAFARCGSLLIDVDKNNTAYSSDDGVLFNKDKTEIVAYAEDALVTEYTIPDSVTSIGNSAFHGCTGLTSITIPDSVTSIGDYAFYYCTALTDVYYTGSKEQWDNITIGDDNDSLTTATIHYLIDDCFTVSNGTVTNTDSVDTHTATIIIAKYTDGVFSGFAQCEEVTFAAGETKTFTVPESGKLFVWDSLEGMRPLTN